MTLNANDWETLYAGRMARDLLFEDTKRLNLDDFVVVSQMYAFSLSLPLASILIHLGLKLD